MRSTAALLLPVLCVSPFCVGAAPAQTANARDAIQARVARMLADVDAARIEATVRKLCSFGSRHPLSATDSATTGTGAARRWLRAQYEEIVTTANGRLAVDLQEVTVPCRRRGMPEEITLVNVIATLRGTTDPERVYVVGGHYDSRNSTGSDGEGRAPGAVDDASGTAVALEACRVMARHEFAATVVFVAYDGEEQGLLGSKAHAAALAEAGTKVDGMITCDIVGNTTGMDGKTYDRYVRCFSYAPTGNDSFGRSMARACSFAQRRHVGDELAVKLIYRGDRYGRGGDHRPFFDQGFPAVRMTEPREDFSRQHQDITMRDGKEYGDLPDYADFGYTARVTKVVVATLAELASAPPPPLVRGARLRRDAYDTEVFFVPPAGVTDFEFVWRETTAADWTHVVPRDDITMGEGRGTVSARLPDVCLDDVVVGVRSVGADGSRSRVATPPEPDRFNNRRGGR